MSGSVQHLRDEIARIHEHMERADDKQDTMAIQIAVLDTHVTQMTKDVSDSKKQLGELRYLKAQLLGGISVIAVVATTVIETLRFWLH